MGIVNCVEGDVSIDGLPVRPIDIGSARIAPGHVIKTEDGMAEVLLAPGSILRLGNHSELVFEKLEMARLSKGEAIVQVIEASNQRPVTVIAKGTTTVIQKPGVYRFDSKRKKHYTALDAWSNMRAEQLSAESAASAQTYAGGAGNWPGPAWYWNPLFGSYLLMPARGSLPPYHGGDAYLYGRPIPASGLHTQPASTPPYGTVPTVPLTAPGVPSFPNSRGRR